jgi:D-amino-acid dehydrogenase
VGVLAPRVRASLNVRCPALGITAARDEPGQYIVPDPIVLIEILSPGNASDTWDNVWSYTTIPSVREIVVVHSTRVFAELLRRGNRVSGVRVNGELIEADAVVVAAGAWAPKILEPVGVQLGVAPQRGQIVHLRLPGTDTARWPVLLPLNSYYLLAFEDSRVVVGATRETNSGFDYRLTAAGVAEVLNAGLAVAPGLASWTVHEIRIGFRPLARDNRPKLGPVPGVDNLLIGNGLGPSGLTMGPYSGALLANATLGKPTELALGPFAVVS